MNSNSEKIEYKQISESAQDIMKNELSLYIPTYPDNICYKKDAKELETSPRLINVDKTYKILGKSNSDIILLDTELDQEFINFLCEKNLDSIDIRREIISVKEKELYEEYYLLLEMQHIIFLMARCGKIEKENLFMRLQSFSNLEKVANLYKMEYMGSSYKLHALFILFYMNERGYMFSEEHKKFLKGYYNSENSIIL